MESTETKMIQQVADILRSQPFLKTDVVADELALLITWSYLSDTEHTGGRIVFDEQQPDVHYAYSEVLAKRFGDAGEVFKRSQLHDTCTGAAIEEIVTVLNSVTPKDPSSLAEALVMAYSQSRSPSQSVTPLGIGQLLVGLAAVEDGSVVLDQSLSASVAPLLPHPKNAVIKIQEHTPLTVALSVLLGVTVQLSERLFEVEPDSQSDHVISVPPFGVRPLRSGQKSRPEEAAITRTAQGIRRRGVVLAPPGILFLSSAYQIRQSLIKSNYLEAVISLKRDVFPFTSTSFILLVIDKNRSENDPVLFLETEGLGSVLNHPEKVIEMVNTRQVSQYGVLCDREAIRKNDYDLSVNRYKLKPAAAQLSAMADSVTLGQVADIIRAQNIIKKEDFAQVDADAFYEAAVRDIDESGQLNPPEKLIEVGGKLLRRAENQRLKPGDILLAVKGSVGRVGFVGDNCGDNWIAGQAFLILRPRGKNISTEYLFRYLSSELVQTYLREMATAGTAMAILRAADVTELPVPLLDPETRQAVEANHRAIMAEYATIQEHRENLRHLETQHWFLHS